MLAGRNTHYPDGGFDPGLRMMPSLRTIVVGCVDPRVDPERLLGVSTGEVATFRNVGGRVVPGVLDELVMLRGVTQAAGGDLGAGWNVLVLHHTDCGITRLQDQPDLLAGYFEMPPADLAARAVGDPRAAVAVDVAAVRAETRLGAGLVVTGAVYDVGTGLVEVLG